MVPRATPQIAMTPNSGQTLKAPLTMRNSPTKAFKPGNPIAARAEHREKRREHRRQLEQPAIRHDRLPRVRPLVDHADAQEERSGDDAVVDHLEYRASMPFRLSVKIPRVTNPMWLMLEYAIRRLTSVWASVTHAPYTIATPESTIIGVTNNRTASGRIGARFAAPVAAHLEENPGKDHTARRRASVWASGSHVCTGNIGTLTANAAVKAPKSHACVPRLSLVAASARKSSVPLV